MSWVGLATLTLLILGPIIVNAQPGEKFYWLGINWKADNLDNTLFWIGIAAIILSIIGFGYQENQKQKLNKKFDSKFDGVSNG